MPENSRPAFLSVNLFMCTNREALLKRRLILVLFIVAEIADGNESVFDTVEFAEMSGFQMHMAMNNKLRTSWQENGEGFHWRPRAFER